MTSEEARQKFIDKWRIYLAGLALYGHVVDTTQGPLQRAAHAVRIPEQVETLLGRLYDDAVTSRTMPAQNGPTAEKKK